jgi:hypothetical protein
MHPLPQAEDSGNPVRYDTASVSIYIEDVNDSPPLFLHSPYIAHVVENAADLPRQASFCLPFCRLFTIITHGLCRGFFPLANSSNSPLPHKTACRYPEPVFIYDLAH